MKRKDEGRSQRKRTHKTENGIRKRWARQQLGKLNKR